MEEQHMAGPPYRYRLQHRRLMDIAPASASDDDSGHHGSNGMAIMVSILVVVIVCTLFYCVYCWRWRKRNAVRRAQIERLRPMSSSDLPLMDLSSIHEATNSFSKENKLGEGGFGPVYRGVMGGGAEIAVKRLSARSRQGAAEFRNEVELIAKLQHRNLVRLLGCCVERDEKMLVYEYLPNRSLDSFLFDSRKSGQLDWKTRQSIVLGIARGMLYLHEDSCLKVIHRDLKASNVLLDNRMNPKISDFGMAKIFEEEGNEPNTGPVVGTYGYMAPEYAMEGVFSVKSDVFSFGVLVLEILSGQRNGSMYLQEHQHTLIQDAWKLWNEDRAAEFMDAALAGSYPRDEAWRCFHVGLLCVQESPDLRPTMSSVVLMLISDQTAQQMPAPAQPPLFASSRLGRKASASDLSLAMKTETTKTQSVNEVSISMMEPR
ncbi:serine/threonine-protein kinase receptor [Zea mays]|uniref:non-specific serine/threonine protein kinase n=1 Tax=Zea mays TaxID=4577 RepID=A0A1D6HHV9_MAIZE|nr:serine/threonine-protein kinase receptor [Zea mays]AQK74106.1 sister of liguleless narrow1 [Zea mays]|eukprot:XP_008643708.1 serine/threonine-protein kinase receptor isoform X1 [Zea mays]